jgi:mono/diheme cytochrome c family protein
MMLNRTFTLSLLVGAALGATLTAASAVRAADQIPAAATKEADEIWSTRCTTCHGPAGKGDGPAGIALTPKPRDLSNAEWQKSVTDEHIENIVLNGGAAVGKSVLMPANPDLSGKAAVVKALRVKVRGLGGK